MKYLTLFVCLTLTGQSVFSQSNGDYRSRQTGNWGTVTTWQVFNSSAWNNLEDAGAGAFQNVLPTSASGAVAIQNTNVVSVAAGVSVDQVTVQSGGELRVNTSTTLTLANGAGNEITINTGGLITNNGTINFVSLSARQVLVNGTYNNAGSASGLTAGELTFGAASTYNHDFTDGGTIPAATWNATSFTVIRGFGPGSSTPPTGRNQNFGNFTWNCPSQDGSSSIDLAAQPNSIQGDFTVQSTGDGSLIYAGSGTPTLTVGNDFTINGGSFGYAITGTSGAGTLTVNGDANFNGGFAQMADDQNLDFNVTGDITISAADVDFAASTATSNINLSGNFTQSGGNLFATAGTAVFNFTGTSTQTYTSTLVPTGTFNYSIGTSAVVSIPGTSFFGGSGGLTVNGTLIVASTHASGAIQTGVSNGNIRVSGTRLYNSGAHIIYQNSVAQFMGNGQPAGAGVLTEINNSSSGGVTLASNATIGGELRLTDGDLSIVSRTLTLKGLLTTSGTTLVVTSASSIVIDGSGTFGTLELSGSANMNGLTINRSSETITLGRDVTVDGTFTHTAGNFDFSGRALTINGPYTHVAGNLLFDATSTLIVKGSGTINALPFGSTTIGSFTLNNSNGASSSNPITIQTQIYLQIGAFTGTGQLTMANGSSFIRGDGSTTKSVSTSGAYNLTYNGTIAVVSPGNPVGNELPTSSTALNNLTISNSVTLDRNITINGALTLSNGTFTAGSNTVNIKGNLISNSNASFATTSLNFTGSTTISGTVNPNFNAFTVSSGSTLNLGTGTTVFVSGNITNNGTITGGTSTIIFNGTTSIDGGGTTAVKGSFNNIQVTGSFAIQCASCVFPTNRYSINVSGDFLVQGAGVFTANLSIVNLNGTTQAISTLGHAFYDLDLGNSGTVTLSEPLTIQQDLTIESTATLNTGADKQINMGDDFTINGTFVPNFGTVVFDGSAGQTISRTSGSSTINFYNIDIAKPATTVFSFETNCNLTNALTFSSSSAFIIDFDGLSSTTAKLTLKSDAVTGRTGQIMSIPDAATISGNIIVERFMEPAPSAAKIYRYISSPVQSAPVSMLQDDFPVTGTFTGRSTCPAFTANARNMYYYNEAVSGNSSNGYVGFPTSNVTETMVSGRGYAVQMCDGASIITWDVSGGISRATTAVPVTISTTYNNTGLPNDDGLNLVGNPFPAPIDWQASGWTKTNLLNTFWIRNNTENTLASFNGDLGIGTNGATRYLAIGQAFWVQAIATSPSLRITEAVKASQQPEYLREMTLNDLLRITLNTENLHDEIVVHFNEKADASPNTFGDSRKLLQSESNLSSYSEEDPNIQLAINSMSQFTCNEVVKLRVADVIPGRYSLSFSGISSFDNTTISLIDLFSGKTESITEGKVYAFEVTDDSVSFGLSRFQVLFNKGESVRGVIANAVTQCNTNAVQINITNPQQGLVYSVRDQSGELLVDKITGTGTSSLLIPLTLSMGSYNLTILGQKSGCSPVLVSMVSNVEVDAIAAIVSSNSSTVCGSGSSMIEVTSRNTTKYLWYESNIAESPMQVTSEGILTTPILNSTRSYFVAPVNNKGCEGERIEVIAQVNSLPTFSVIVDNGILKASGDGAFKWYLNGELLANETNSLRFTKPGDYLIESTLKGCLVTHSITITEHDLSEKVIIAPNPFSDAIKILIYTDEPELSASLIGSDGRIIRQFKISKTSTDFAEVEIQLKDISPGIYILQIIDGVNVFNKRIIKK